MSSHFLRILSDIHYGEGSSRVHSLAALRPLCDVPELLLNGDTVDTRPGPFPERTAQLRADVDGFFSEMDASVTFHSGNHDPDISETHVTDLAGGQVLVTHGDALFEEIVPWSAHLPQIREKLAALAGAFASEPARLETRLALFRQVCALLPQDEFVHRANAGFFARFFTDVAWPPRLWNILRAWHETPRRAAQLAAQHRPQAGFVIVGHTHRPGIWRRQGRVVINTGSFCPPLGALAVDLTSERLIVRKIEPRRGEFQTVATVAEFALAATPASSTTRTS